MFITFKSIIRNEAVITNKIEFKSPVEIFDEFGFKVYQFVEPSQNVMNRIEVSPGAINIFTGPSTLNLALNQDLNIEYATAHGAIYITSHLQKVQMNDHKVTFQYTLKQKQTLVGNYHITLEIHNS